MEITVLSKYLKLLFCLIIFSGVCVKNTFCSLQLIKSKKPYSQIRAEVRELEYILEVANGLGWNRRIREVEDKLIEKVQESEECYFENCDEVSNSDIMELVLSKLDLQSLGRFAQVSKYFEALAKPMLSRIEIGGNVIAERLIVEHNLSHDNDRINVNVIYDVLENLQKNFSLEKDPLSKNILGQALRYFLKNVDIFYQSNSLSRRNKGTTTLHLAIEKNNSELIKLLFPLFAKVNRLNIQDGSGNTPLHLAILYKNTELSKLLINLNVKFNISNYQGTMPLHWTVRYNPEIAKLLIAKIVKQEESYSIINAKMGRFNGNDCNTALHLAIENRNAELVKLLIAAGANITIPNNENNTPLQLAISIANENGDIEKDDIVKLLRKSRNY